LNQRLGGLRRKMSDALEERKKRILAASRGISGARKPAPAAAAAPALTINKKYAEKFEYQKRRAELADAGNLEDLAAGGDSSSSSRDDEDGEALTKSMDKQINRTIRLLKSKDASIYDPETKLYGSSDEDESDDEDGGSEDDSSDSDSDSGSGDQKHTPAKRMTLKDVMRERIQSKIDADPNVIPGDYSDSESEDEAAKPSTKGPTYVQEQAALKREMRETVHTKAENAIEDDTDSFCPAPPWASNRL
jgi:protein KRI1